ncbi:MAG TPA: hypothetical protein VFM06_09570 [Candidatus Limnocylindria bacterium]|nr:hypothetical protein [Candidatus Limnocylindria bacterium]
MGAAGQSLTRRALLALAAAFAIALPFPNEPGAAAPASADEHRVAALRAQPIIESEARLHLGARFEDTASAIAIDPPAGWVASPATALNPASDPPEPVEEVARFQLRIGDAKLYSAPIPVTSGLVADAIAVISIGVAREGSDLPALDRDVRGMFETAHVPGFLTLEDEATYEGLHVLTRYLFSRTGDRVLVARAAAAETSWTDFVATIRASLATFGGDPRAANAPAPPPPPPSPPPPAPAPDASLARRDQILQRAASLLGLRYVWGGNSTTGGMDCSAYVSWVWGVPRYTTDSIWNVSFPITKGELRAGDALNLTIGRDPRRLGHIRLFEAWANTERTAMWVYEETPPRVVHRVIAYDDRYQPIRLAGLSGAGEARVVPGTPAPVRVATPAPRRPAATAAVTRRPTPTVAPWPAWWANWTPRPRATATPTVAPTRPATPAPTTRPSPTPTPRPTTAP